MIDEDVPAECRPDEVSFLVRWSAESDDTLRGKLIARNISERVWRITGKPVLCLVAATGEELNNRRYINMDLRIPPWVLVEPGAAVAAYAIMHTWDGTPLADHLIVEWDGGRKVAPIEGPRRTDRSHRMSTSSGWFEPHSGD